MVHAAVILLRPPCPPTPYRVVVRELCGRLYHMAAEYLFMMGGRRNHLCVGVWKTDHLKMVRGHTRKGLCFSGEGILSNGLFNIASFSWPSQRSFSGLYVANVIEETWDQCFIPKCYHNPLDMLALFPGLHPSFCLLQRHGGSPGTRLWTCPYGVEFDDR